MDDSIRVGWILVVLLGILSGVLLMGRGAFLIAGYNTSSETEKAGYNIKRLCRVVGAGFGGITVISTLFMLYNGELPPNLEWMMPWGILGAIMMIFILANTICKRKDTSFTKHK